MTNEECKAADRQVGGDHYKRMAMQPFAYIHANGLGFAEGNVIKYVSRWRHKNGLQDLEKAAHYLQLLIDAERATAEPEPLEPHDWSESPDIETTQASSGPDAWPKDGDMYWTWTRGVRDCQPMTFPWYRTGYDRERFAAGEVFRTRDEAVAEWTRQYGKTTRAASYESDAGDPAMWMGDEDTPPELELNDAEKQMVRDRLIIPAIKSLRKRWHAAHPYSLSLVDAKKIVEAYRDSLKASETKVKEPWIDVTKCPTGVPENGDWYPQIGDRVWIANGTPINRQRWTWNSLHMDLLLQSLEAGEVCRTRAIARAVNRRKKAEVAK